MAANDRHRSRSNPLRIAINPNDIAARALYASKLCSKGRIEESLAHLDVAERLDQFGIFWIPLIKGAVMFTARRYEESLAAMYAMTSPPNEARIIMIAALGQLGRLEEADRILEQLLHSAKQEMPHFPGPRLDDWRAIVHRVRGEPAIGETDHMIESLQMAGWA